VRESIIWKLVLLAVSRIRGVKLFRNNVGQAWTSPKSFTLKKGQVYHARGGERVLMTPYPINFGLMKGSGDGIGWRTLTITPEMVGRDIAQFVSVETKTDKGRVREEQETWQANVNKAGGLAVIVRSAEEAEEYLRQLEI
jgi:virulence-associated protein VagC